MSFDDFEVVAYKVLAYLCACLKEGVSPSVDKARELTRVNEVYFDAVVSSLFSDGLVAGSVLRDMNGTVVSVGSLTLTLDGAAYLKGDSTMGKVKRALGTAFEFWCSDILTGSQTAPRALPAFSWFWRSDILTGGQTRMTGLRRGIPSCT